MKIKSLSLPDLGYVDSALLESAGCYEVDSIEGARLLGRERQLYKGADFSGICIPFLWPQNEHARENCLRLNNPLVDDKSKPKRYLFPYGHQGKLWIHPDTPIEWLEDSATTLVITEGAKKTYALYKYAQSRNERWVVVGISGVHGFLAKTGVVRDGGGHIIEERRGLLPDFQRLALDQRDTRITFDTNLHLDTAGGSNGRAARRRLTRELMAYGALVKWWDLPAALPPEINGVDDFLTAYGEEEFAQVIQDCIARNDGRETACLELTPQGMLERVLQAYPGEFVFCEALGGFAFWNGSYWDFNRGESQFSLKIMETARAAYAAELETLLSEIKDGHTPEDNQRVEKEREKLRGRFYNFCLSYRDPIGIKKIFTLAEWDERILRQSSEFDADPWLLNCLNGTLDCATGNLKDADSSDLITRVAPTEYHADAGCSQFESFLNKIFQDKSELINLVQEILGYCCTGDTSAQRLWVFHGASGQNGKNALLDTVSEILGPHYAATADWESFGTRARSGHTDDLASLNGKRLIISSELRENAELDESRIKRWTGDLRARVSFKGLTNFEMRITGKIIVPSNVEPDIKGNDGGIKRRVTFIPFDYRITEVERKDNFYLELLRERDGILAWMVRGIQRKLTLGWTDVDAVNEKGEEFWDATDEVLDFLNTRCEIAPDLKISTTALHAAYLCHVGQNARYQSSHRFSGALRQKGYKLDHTYKGSFVLGLKIRYDEDAQES